MPLYEYKCQRCGKEFEKLVFNREERIACPECNSEDVKKKFSVFGMSGVENSGSSCSGCSGSTCSTCH